MTLQNPVDQAEGQCFLGRHKVVTLTGSSDFFHALAGILRQDPVHAGFDGFQTLQMNGHIRDLALGTGRRLMDHDFRIGQSHTLALCTGTQQEGTHGCRHAYTNGSNIAFDVLHGIINRHTGSNAAARAVDIELNILVRILCL